MGMKTGKNQTPRPLRIGRSIVAVLAGMFAGAILSLGTDQLMRAAGLLPALGKQTDAQLLFAVTYRTVYTILGSYIVARLAPHRPMQHALVSGALGLVLSALGASATWDSGLGPHWYPLALAALPLPCAWLGGTLRTAQLAQSD
jgi:hypothetical protein